MSKKPWEIIPGVIQRVTPTNDLGRQFCTWEIGSIVLAEAERTRGSKNETDWTLYFWNGQSRLTLVEFQPNLDKCEERVGYMLERINPGA